jgi:hypothetical protein
VEEEETNCWKKKCPLLLLLVLHRNGCYPPPLFILLVLHGNGCCPPPLLLLLVLHKNGCCPLLLLLNKNVCCEDQVILQHFIQQALTDTSNQKTNCLLKWKKQNLDLVLHCKSGSCVTTIYCKLNVVLDDE